MTGKEAYSLVVFCSLCLPFIWIVGSKTPKDCPSGSFSNTTRASVCQKCPTGYFCTPVNVTAGDPRSGYHICPRGYYCPSGMIYFRSFCSGKKSRFFRIGKYKTNKEKNCSRIWTVSTVKILSSVFFTNRGLDYLADFTNKCRILTLTLTKKIILTMRKPKPNPKKTLTLTLKRRKMDKITARRFDRWKL